MPVTDPEALIGATEAMAILDVDRSTITRWVAAEKLTPIGRIGGNDAYVFRQIDVERIAAERKSAADAKSGAA